MNTLNNHAEVIKAWASGITIQKKVLSGEWMDIFGPGSLTSFGFYADDEYRIKPNKKKMYVVIVREKDLVIPIPPLTIARQDKKIIEKDYPKSKYNYLCDIVEIEYESEN